MSKFIRIGYDGRNFTVNLPSGQQLQFEKAKNVAGNLANWLAALKQKHEPEQEAPAEPMRFGRGTRLCEKHGCLEIACGCNKALWGKA